MKNLLKIGVISALLVGSTYASDLLSSLTNGKISDSSTGVKVLNLDEMKQVKGGVIMFDRASQYDFSAGYNTSYAYIVKDTDKNYQDFLQSMNIEGDKLVLAKYRFVNGQKEYYLQSYDKNTGTLRDIWASVGSPALEVLNQFKNQH